MQFSLGKAKYSLYYTLSINMLVIGIASNLGTPHFQKISRSLLALIRDSAVPNESAARRAGALHRAAGSSSGSECGYLELHKIRVNTVDRQGPLRRRRT